MEEAVAALRRIVGEISILGSSPLVRAKQTAKIVSQVYDGLAVTTVDALKPGKPLKSVLSWIQGHPADTTVALVGHEPQLGLLASWLLCGEQRRSFVPLKKGGVCCLSFDQSVQSGKAALDWMLKPSQLRDLGN
jgi:phosphohistidine phosphatase